MTDSNKGGEERRWPAITMVRSIALFFAFLVLLLFLWMSRHVLMIAFLGVLFGLALTAGVDWLEKRRVRRALGAVGITIAFLAALVGIGALIAPTLRDQAFELQEKLPQSVDKIDRWLGRKTAALAQTVTTPVAAEGQQPQQQTPQRKQQTAAQKQQQPQIQRSLREQIAAPLRGIARYLFPFISTTFAAFAALVLIIFIAIYIASDPGLYHRGLLHLIPHRRRKRGDEVLCSLEDVLRRWLVARLLAMLAVGLLTTGLLTLLRVRAAVALGVVAGILEFIPYFGPIVSAIPAVGIALLDSPQKATAVVIAFIVIQQLEGNVITPLLLKNRVDIPPVLTIVTVASMGVALGIGGALVAEPLLAATLVAVKMLYVEGVIGDEVHETPEKC